MSASDHSPPPAAAAWSKEKYELMEMIGAEDLSIPVNRGVTMYNHHFWWLNVRPSTLLLLLLLLGKGIDMSKEAFRHTDWMNCFHNYSVPQILESSQLDNI
mmetsp:Transcript_24018/g.32908  ORF Transcript_24018/g.32908 Transcript_24018/m.32908 type:complete len:101 (-) Transcript_24018:296-598(-)